MRRDLQRGGRTRVLRRRGSVLVAVLWCLALLAVVVVGILHGARTDLQLARQHDDRIQARYLALSGVERAKALLYQDARDRTRTGQSHSGNLFNAPRSFRDIELGRGTYRVFHGARAEDGGGLAFGVTDEESRLNVNTVNADDLRRIQGLTPDLPPAIMDWRDNDNAVTAGGAETEFYASQRPPGKARNAPFETLRELLMIRNLPRDQFVGDDPQLNGVGNAEGDAEADPDATTAASTGGGSVGTGWSSMFTVNSGVANVSATGLDRVNVQSADQSSLTGVRGITTDIARAIVAYRGQNRLGSIADLLDVPTAPPTQTPGGNPINPAGPGVPGNQAAPNAPQNAGGRKVIDQNLLIEIADSLTTQDGTTLSGVINVNTASLEVLACLPGVSRELAQAIVAYRSSNGFLANIAELLRVQGLTADLFKQLAPRVTTRSETFRILAEGRIRSSGVRQRIEAIVRIGLYDVQMLSYREDDL